MTKNPFIFGEAVLGEHFADRRKELKELVRDLSDGERIFLISPRRYGKTSLIMNAIEELKSKGFYTVYIDLYKATSIHKLLEIYAREISRTVESKLEKMLDFFKQTLPGLHPKVTVGPNGTTSLGIEYVTSQDDTVKFLDEIYDLPQKLAAEKKQSFVVVFDEFQEVRNFNGDAIEKAMRASFQQHNKVAYLFAGSKRHILYDMVSNQDRAFYMMGRVMTLSKIPRSEFREFLEQAFERTGFELETETVNKVLDLVSDFPYNAQFFCHKLWDEFFETKKITLENVNPTLDRILTEHTPFYLSIWDGLSLHQRRVLQAIVQRGGKGMFSQDYIRANDLGAVSTVQTSVRLLTKKQILDKDNDTYWITDVFFREWIKKDM